LILKSQCDTNYNQLITTISRDEFKLKFILDDPSETKVQSLSWYLEKIKQVPSVLFEYSSTEREGFELQNSKCAFISGIAVGLGLKVLMIAEEPYSTPLDYKEILQKFNNSEKCRSIISPFFREIKEDILSLFSKKKNYQRVEKERSLLAKINFGEFLAEHEYQDLPDYYIDIFNAKEFIKSEYNIVVGRKGSGKTAALYFLKNVLEKDIRNHICFIKPINFQIDSLIYLLDNLDENYEKGNLIESSWKFLIYTELAKSIYEKIKAKPLYAQDESEIQFSNYIDSNSHLFLDDFSVKLEKELRKVSKEDFGEDISSLKIKLSEIMHEEVLKEIKILLNNLFAKKKDSKIIVLIDNLDKSWNKNNKIELQSQLILGLLGVTGRIVNDLSSAHGQSSNIKFHLTIFLRSDIFNYVLKYAREPDKIEYKKIQTNDRDILFRIIEERFIRLSEGEFLPEDLWQKFMIPEIDGQPIKSYIFDRIIPRPRDIIFFFKNARDNAITRGHTTIEKSDIEQAYKDYSSWFFGSVLVENGITINQMKDFLYELFGLSTILSTDDLLNCLIKSRINDVDIDYFIDRLVSLSILGREIRDNEFFFDNDFDSIEKTKVLASKLNSNRFKIHSALTSYLESQQI
jgi:energy-coupling factor transporter ATP-binding protein EcfA2